VKKANRIIIIILIGLGNGADGGLGRYVQKWTNELDEFAWTSPSFVFLELILLLLLSLYPKEIALVCSLMDANEE
jgi:hypothetical protein